MGLVTTFLVPLALLLPAADVAAPVADAITAQGESADPFTFVPGVFVAHATPDRGAQVRIEQSLRIRISPQRTQVSQTRPDMLVGVPQRSIGSSFDERRIGRCLSINAISGVQPNGGSDLILYLRDRRMVKAQLERSCRSREFYSGFYVSGEDGRLCVDRDMLQSRSGTNCKLAELRQLVETGG